MPTSSKRYRTAQKSGDLNKAYPLADAIGLLKRMPNAKFDETVELSCHLGVDPRHSDQMVRGVVNLPHGSGKKVKVIAFTENPEVALAAGADAAGLEDLIKKITEENWLDFEVAIATPNAMKLVRNVARVLGPRGLMPNPKSGTVTEDVAGAVKAVKLGGRVEFKMDKTANLGVVVGKKSFDEAALVANIQAVLAGLSAAKPSTLKGKFVESASVSSTMSPGVKLESAVYATL